MPDPGFTQVTGNIVDGNDVPVVGSLRFYPVDSLQRPVSVQANGMALSGARKNCSSDYVPATLSTDGSFSVTLVDTGLSNPKNFGYRLEVYRAQTNDQIFGLGYDFIQPTGSSWSLNDNFQPKGYPGALQQAGPTGLSAYEVYQKNGGQLSQAAWLASLTDNPLVKSDAALALLYSTPGSTVSTLGTDPGTGQPFTGAGITYISQAGIGAVAGNPWIESISLNLQDQGGTKFFEVLICEYNAGNDLTIVDRFTLGNVSAGMQTVYAGVDYTPRQLKTNQYLGWYSTGWGVSYHNGGSGPNMWYSGSNPPASTGTRTTYIYSGPPSWQFGFVASLRAIPATANSVYKTASALGCALDNSTDDGPKINAFLAQATTTSGRFVVLDGVAAHTGIVLSPNGNCGIIGLGKYTTGLRLVPSYSNGIRIGPWSPTNLTGYDSANPWGDNTGINPQPDPSLRSGYVLKNFFIHGEGNADTAPGNYPVQGAPAYGMFLLLMFNCSNVLVENIHFYNTMLYCSYFGNIKNLTVRGISAESSNYTEDGIHINGPASNVFISECEFATGDDAIALNAPEGGGGNIDNVIIDRCRFNGSYSAMRVYTSVGGKTFAVSRVRISNCTGTVQTSAFLLGLESYLGTQSSTPPSQIQDIEIAHCNLKSTGTNDVSTKSSYLVDAMCPIGLLKVVSTIFQNTQTAVAYAPIHVQAGWGVDDLVIEDFTLRRDSSNGAALPSLITVDGTVGRLTISGMRLADTSGTSFSSVASVFSGTGVLSELHIADLQPKHIASLAASFNNTFSNIGVIYGAGVAASGFQIPDATIGNNTLYLTTAAKLAIKIAGTVKLLTA